MQPIDRLIDPTIADWFVPMNDDSVSGLRLILQAFENSIKIGQEKFNEQQLAKEAKRQRN